jgi:N-methylhydantoinase A
MRVAIDIGGTFTDILLFNDDYGQLWSSKISSNPKNPADPFIQGLENALKIAKTHISQVDHIIHATTVVTNALFERNIAKVGLLVTSGFGDILEIGRQKRPNLYHLTTHKPPPLVPRSRVREINERITAIGEVLIPLDEVDAETKLLELIELGIESLAIVLLFSFKNVDHERRLVEIASKIMPGLPIFPSHQILAEFREYERASTTVIAAAVAPQVVTYVKSIKERLRIFDGKEDRFMIMHSGGGTLTATEAATRPHTLIESGPAAGLIASSHLAQNLNLPRVIAFDMGGTTAKSGLILEGKPQFSSEYEVGSEVHASVRISGSGYPLRSPMIDVIECGAGAGSIAWVDAGYHLKVGPQSAGADPGPACYGMSGNEPTVTDAHLILGRLAPDSFLGGEFPLRPDLAKQALTSHVCRKLKMTPEQASAGILAIVNANMLRILRVVTVARGHNPRDFTLIAYGGAGPMHATDLAADLGISQLIVPRLPGLFSALGLLYADLSKSFLETVMILLTDEFLNVINASLSQLTFAAENWFEHNHINQQDRDLQISADLRYLRQNYELKISFPAFPLTPEDISSITKKFHQEHHKVYGHSAPGERVQLVNLHILAVKQVTVPQFSKIEAANRSIQTAIIGTRKVWFSGDFQECNIFDRAALQAGHNLQGPAIVQEKEATTVVNPGQQLLVDQFGNLVIRLK